MSKGISLHIGLNKVDSKVYGNSVAELKGCINDANDMLSICKKSGYKESKILTDSSATVENVKREIINISKIIEPGDIFVISYSGHGTNIKDNSNDEADRRDECWCLYNNLLVDDELCKLWGLFKKDTRIFVLSDSCNSGTVIKDISTTYKYIPENIAQAIYDKNKEACDILSQDKKVNLETTVKLISACQDDETAADGIKNGLFTEKLLKVWDNGNFVGDYNKFYKDIAKMTEPTQKPNYLTIGKKNSKFDTEKPFKI